MPALDGRVRFHARVLLNVLSILEREWDGEEAAVAAEWERLRTLLDATDERPPDRQGNDRSGQSWNTELSSRIRAGDFDDRFDETVSALYETIVDKLAIANPRWMNREEG